MLFQYARQFLQFWAFLLVYVTILERDHMKICFYCKYAYFKEQYSVFKIILWFGCNVILLMSTITSIEKIWTLVNCISWCLKDHVGIWTKFVNVSGGLSEYLFSVMGSFGHLFIFGCQVVTRLCLLWFWGMNFSGASKITGSFLIFSLHFHT